MKRSKLTKIQDKISMYVPNEVLIVGTLLTSGVTVGIVIGYFVWGHGG